MKETSNNIMVVMQDSNKLKCSCGHYELFGLPCSHRLAVYFQIKRESMLRNKEMELLEMPENIKFIKLAEVRK